ncbi:MAG: PGF-CTERM sorting domain-containing protein [Candidatus Methanospirareceae archaeon]
MIQEPGVIQEPGFEAMFTIAGILMIYLIRRRI